MRQEGECGGRHFQRDGVLYRFDHYLDHYLDRSGSSQPGRCRRQMEHARSADEWNRHVNDELRVDCDYQHVWLDYHLPWSEGDAG
jgi:hypothetical protein